MRLRHQSLDNKFVVGFTTGSLILIADAVHNLTDSLTLALSWLVSAGLRILITHKTWIDTLVNTIVSIGLLYAAYGILRQATNIFLEGVKERESYRQKTHLLLLLYSSNHKLNGSKR